MLVAVVGLCAAHWAAAHEGATGIVLERMKAMGDVADEMKVLIRLSKDIKAPLPEIAGRAKRIQDLVQNFTAMFPPGSDKDQATEATGAIWQNWSDFERMSKEVESYAANVARAAENGDRAKVRETFSALAQTCGSCHERFRAEHHH